MATATDPEVAEVLDTFCAAADQLLTVGLTPVDGVDASTVIRGLEKGARVVRAAQVGLVDEVDRPGLYQGDGHRSAKVMVRHAANLSDAEALRRAKAQRALRDLPAVAAAFRTGCIGACQVERIARVYANPRVRHQLIDVDVDLAVVAARLPYRELDAYLTNWERLADEDGAGDDAERDHVRRAFRIGTNLNGSVFIDGNLASLNGAELREVHEHFVEAELAADWAEARERLGDGATFDDLIRTDAQRRADALMAIVRAAASALASQKGGSVVVTNIVMDLATFERHLRAMCSDEPNLGPDPRAATLFADVVADLEGADVAPESDVAPETEVASRSEAPPPSGIGFRCSTLDGTPVDPAEATYAALVGHVRRVVVGSDGVVLDMGRRARLFTGPRQLAVRLQSTTCIWTGCHVPNSRCQSDHLDAFNGPERGRTDPGNLTSCQSILWSGGPCRSCCSPLRRQRTKPGDLPCPGCRLGKASADSPQPSCRRAKRGSRDRREGRTKGPSLACVHR